MPENFNLQLIAILLLLLSGALISSFETAITAISRAKIYRFASQGNKKAKTFAKLLEKREGLSA